MLLDSSFYGVTFLKISVVHVCAFFSFHSLFPFKLPFFLFWPLVLNVGGFPEISGDLSLTARIGEQGNKNLIEIPKNAAL